MTVGADVVESVLPKTGSMFVCELPTRSSYIIEVLLLGGFKTDPSEEQKRVVLVSRIKEDPGLVRATEKACKNRKVQDGINHLLDQLEKGNLNPEAENVPLGNGLTEHRHKKGGRVVSRIRGNVVKILGKSGKRKANQDFVIKRVKRNLKRGLYD